MRKRLHLTESSLLRPRTAAQKAAIAAGVRAEVWPLLEAGTFRPIIDSVFPLREAPPPTAGSRTAAMSARSCSRSAAA